MTEHYPTSLVKLDDLRDDPENPQAHNNAEIQRLVGVIGEVGFIQPIAVDATTMQIIAGHGRAEAARLCHMTEIPAVLVHDYDERKRRLALISTNGNYGHFDDDALTALLRTLETDGNDLDLTGLEPFTIEELLGTGQPAGLTDPDDVPDAPETPITQRGDVILLGRHRLMCGDSTNREDVETLMGSAEPVLMVTDPPYGVQLDQGWRDRIEGVNRLGKAQADAMHNDDAADWTAAWEVCRARVAFVWHAATFASVVKQSLETAGFEVKQQIIWVKSMAPMGRSYYHWKHEPCWFAVRKGQTIPWHVGRDQVTVWEAASPKHIMGGSDEKKMDHPTQKPAEIFAIPIRNHTRTGEVIYDPFLGSGTAIVAAEQEGRVCYGMEIDPKYCDVIVARWEAFTGQTAQRPVAV